MIGVRGKVLKHTYIPTGMKRELMKFGENYDQKRQVVGIIHGRSVNEWPFVLHKQS